MIDRMELIQGIVEVKVRNAVIKSCGGVFKHLLWSDVTKWIADVNRPIGQTNYFGQKCSRGILFC